MNQTDSPIPIIRLELEGMRQSITTALCTYNDHISEEVEKELTKVIANFDFSKVVSEVAGNILQELISKYFKYGAGRNILEETISVALDKAFNIKVRDKVEDVE